MDIKCQELFIFKLTHKKVKKNTFLDTKVRNFLLYSEFPIFCFVDRHCYYVDGHCLFNDCASISNGRFIDALWGWKKMIFLRGITHQEKLSKWRSFTYIFANSHYPSPWRSPWLSALNHKPNFTFNCCGLLLFMPN